LAAFAFIEYIWAGVSFSVLKLGVHQWLPASFIAYVIFGVAFGVALSMRARKLGSSVPAVPNWSILSGIVFGAYFCIASAVVFLWA
ncbi:hypothetical protein, partial [Nevskia sp.]|uniref:hypothetical protein n=1 Tax=Nevskia sp. TaxID=1929292 RepID=UPI0025D2A43B